MQRLINDQLGMLMHAQLHHRLTTFALTITPEFPAEVVVGDWLQRFYNGDNNIHILVDFDNAYQITAHCVILVNEAYGYRACICYQLHDDKKSATLTKGFGTECLEYIDKLVNETSSVCSMLTMTKGIKVLEGKFGYKSVRTVLIKGIDDLVDTT